MPFKLFGRKLGLGKLCKHTFSIIDGDECCISFALLFFVWCTGRSVCVQPNNLDMSLLFRGKIRFLSGLLPGNDQRVISINFAYEALLQYNKYRLLFGFSTIE